MRFLVWDRDWGAGFDFDFERRESREGGEVEAEEEAEGSRKTEGIEQRRDRFLSVQVGRFLVVCVERHCL